MKKKILLTGATDGIGLATAKILVAQGHHLFIHGRNPQKLKDAEEQLKTINGNAFIESYIADLSDIDATKKLADDIKSKHDQLDVIINNAGIYKTNTPITDAGYDVRFVVNTIAPYVITNLLLPLLNRTSRVINLSSAAQAPVNIDALMGKKIIDDQLNAYAQSKLAITAWSQLLSEEWKDNGPVIISVNPGSLLASKMVHEGFGIAGNDISIGANILVSLSLDAVHADKSGQYFDNDKGAFTEPYAATNDKQQAEQLIQALNSFL